MIETSNTSKGLDEWNEIKRVLTVFFNKIN